MLWNIEKAQDFPEGKAWQEWSFPSTRHTSFRSAIREHSHWVAKERGNWNSFTNMVILKLSPLRTSSLEFSELGNIFCKPNLLWGFKNHFSVKFWTENEKFVSAAAIFNQCWTLHLPNTVLPAFHYVAPSWGTRRGVFWKYSVSPNWRPQEGRKKGGAEGGKLDIWHSGP